MRGYGDPSTTHGRYRSVRLRDNAAATAMQPPCIATTKPSLRRTTPMSTPVSHSFILNVARMVFGGARQDKAFDVSITARTGGGQQANQGVDLDLNGY